MGVFFLKMRVTKVGDEPCQEDGSLVLTYGRWATEVYIGKKAGEGGDSKKNEGRSAIDGLLFSFPREELGSQNYDGTVDWRGSWRGKS